MSVAGVPAGLSLKEQLVLLNEYADSSNVGVVLSSMLYGIFVVCVLHAGGFHRICETDSLTGLVARCIFTQPATPRTQTRLLSEVW